MNDRPFSAVWRDTIEGTSAVARLTRLALAPFAVGYGLAAKIRRDLYATGVLRSHAVPVPVISVGNLSVGGTGKTPFVMMLAGMLVEIGFAENEIGILSRGYGARADGWNDEVGLIAARFPSAAHMACPDRVAGARKLVERGVKIILLDDAFQHRRIRRDLDIVLLNRAEGFSNGLPLPAGVLREFPSTVGRADVVVATGQPGKNWAAAAAAVERLKLPFFTASTAVRKIRPLAGGAKLAPDGKGRTAVVFSGLARNSGFADTVRSLGFGILAQIEFPDHHAYTPRDAVRVTREFERQKPDVVLTTGKDAIKLAGAAGWPPIHVVEIEMKMDDPARFIGIVKQRVC